MPAAPCAPHRVRATLFALVVVAAVLGLAVAPPRGVGGAGTAVAGADPSPASTVTVTPVSNLVDGRAVTINVKAAPGFNVYQGRAAQCRAGVAYQPSVAPHIIYNDDAKPNGPNCPLAKISSSATDAVVDSNMITGAASPDGETLSLRVGVGVASWVDPNTGVAETLTCDPTHPCDLLLELLAGPSDGSSVPTWTPYTQQLTFADSDPLATCGGPAVDALSTGASDSLVDAWTQWTLDQCRQPGQTGAATRASFVGEGQAVQQFDAGSLDLAYTAAGNDGDVGLADGASGAPDRPSVAVPVGIGAVTLGVGNGYGSGGRKVPFPTISLTAGEMATIVGSGQYTTAEQQAPVVARNPDLGAAFFAPSTDLQVGVPSGSSASTWYLSNYLTKTAAGTWRVPNVGAAGSQVGAPRGTFDDFGTTSPDFDLLTTYTGRPALERVLYGIETNTFLLGGVFVVSDLTTADAEALSPVAVQTTSSGPFVAPTQASMDAAVADMRPDAQGLLQPDPTPTDPNAYPLTYVVYAVVPAQPLVDASCAPRAGAQHQLATWLTYLTGAGQRVLPDGLEPLTPALATQAASAIAQVGTAPSTCTAPPGGSASGGSSAGANGSSGGSDAGSSSSGSSGDTGSGAADTVSASGPPAALGRPATIAAKVPIPPYGGSRAADVVATVVALAGIVALVSLAARYTASLASSADPDDPDDPDGHGDQDGSVR